MYTSGPKRSWDNFVRAEPLFAAVSDPKFLKAQLTPAAEQEFFKLGENHINAVLGDIRQHIDPNFAPTRALDFGCGPGRLVVPLTHICNKVTGIDLNPHMIEVARKKSRRYGAHEADFYLSDELTKGLQDKYDFIHSVIVFQHIPVKEGEKIVDRLLDHLEPGGVGALHFTLHRKAPLWRKAVNRARVFWPVNVLVNLIQGKDLDHPLCPNELV
jgi:2-polyprenyl-3-methyl-5-hydroxy-6-metoxy-1,4-benzoquinol methylase